MAEKYSNEKIASNNADSDKDDSQKKIASGIAATEAAVVSTRQAAVEYAQPNTYTGNRALYVHFQPFLCLNGFFFDYYITVIQV